ncbi:MAG: hypothetical protein ACRC2N_04825 [Aeromonas sp.]
MPKTLTKAAGSCVAKFSVTKGNSGWDPNAKALFLVRVVVQARVITREAEEKDKQVRSQEKAEVQGHRQQTQSNKQSKVNRQAATGQQTVDKKGIRNRKDKPGNNAQSCQPGQ